MSYGKSVQFDGLRSLAFGSVTASYVAVGGAFTSKQRSITIENLTDKTLLFSYDGVNDNDALPAGGLKIYDFTANSTHQTDTPFMAVGTTVYVKATSGGNLPTTGSVYVVAFHCQGD